MGKKKKGSSLITVVIIFTILITVGTAMLSMTVGDYKIRIKESKRIENLYKSDSGLDVAYDVIIKTFDGAVKFGDFKARQLKSGNATGGPNKENYNSARAELEEVKSKHYSSEDKKRKAIRAAEKKFDERVQELSDNEFKRCFRVFISKDQFNNEDTESNIPSNILAESIKEHKYKELNIENKNLDSELNLNNYNYTSIEINNNESNQELFVCSKDSVDKLKEIVNEEGKDKDLTSIKDDIYGISYDSNNDAFKIQVTSKFIDKSKNNTDITKNNLRIVQETYTINVPNHEDVSFKESTAIVGTFDDVKNVSSMLVGGDIKIDGKDNLGNPLGSLNVNGNIFVQGNKEDKNNRVYDKYKGGININNSNVIFNGDVNTAGTFNIGDNAKSTVNGNLYALNIFAGKTTNGKYANEFGGSSSLNINGQAVLDNDLTLKGVDTSIKIKDFYGLNDKNIESSKNNTSDKLERTSSSIIVNGNKNSGVKITDSAYIMGVAHIADGSISYTTGESTGVKGNYIAYVDKEIAKSNDPYDVGNYMSGNLQDKSGKFTNYWGKGRKEIIDTGGIELPKDNTNAIGAIVYKDVNGNTVIENNTYKIKAEDSIRSKKEEFSKKVYNLNREISKDIAMELYNNMGNNKNPIESIINLENIPNSYELNDSINKSKKAIFNKDSDTTIVIKGKGSISSKELENNKLIILDAGNVNLDAVIVTVGDVIIDGNVKFKGNIITEGNLKVQGSGDKTITYDKDTIEEIYKYNKDVFNSVFVDDTKDLKDSTDDETRFINVNYDLNKFLSSRLWKIIR
ncbi:DUF2572 family protein [Clostridium botulinum]|uniref:DUF2572 family protein n=1 Tax=Clostridium botulinum TaxID=1491 RepID=UPI0013F000DC|nr:DUF2572 family protein [Clostridium botulinum]MBN1049959.1 DUF2572 family protein [Clostridium botulinum]NFO33629.1 DUF2572 family protein [Clostridium botulinum]